MLDPKIIEAAKQKALDALAMRIDGMGSIANDILLQVLEETFDFKGGKIIADEDFVRLLNKLTVDVLDLLQKTPKFTGPVSQFVKRMPAISDAISDFQKSMGITVPAFETSKKIVIDEILEQMTGNGLNQHFAQPLRDMIYQNATSGLAMKETREQIKAYIQGGKDKSGKFGRYMEQTSIQAVDSYSGIINKKLLETFDYDGLLITGSLIDNSSPQCRYAIEELGGTIKRTDWPKLEEIAKKNGLIQGTTFDNLPLNLLHWGCRHAFFPIKIKKAA